MFVLRRLLPLVVLAGCATVQDPSYQDTSFDPSTESYSVSLWFKIDDFSNNLEAANLHLIADRPRGSTGAMSYSFRLHKQSHELDNEREDSDQIEAEERLLAAGVEDESVVPERERE